MYEVYVDGKLLFYPGEESHELISPVVKKKLNDCGTFEFSVPISNTEYGTIKNRKSMIQVVKNNKEIFYGEVRECSKDFQQVKDIYAVGELAFLFDSIQPRGEFHDISPREFLDTLLRAHNAQTEERKHFQVGIVTVHDANDSLYRYTNRENTLDAIREKLCTPLNGYLRVRKVNGIRYLDLVELQDYGKICEQSIEFGENLLDYSESLSASDLATACIPLGKHLEETEIAALDAYTDITSVNDGKDYLYIPEAVEQFGWVKKVVHFEDVGLPENLKQKGMNWLTDNQYEQLSLSLNAIDLSILHVDYDSFELGDSVHALATPFGMNRYFPVQSLEIHLQEPERDELKLGDIINQSYTDITDSTIKENEVEFQQREYERSQWLQAAIDNATQILTGSKGGYRLDEYDKNGLFLRTLYMDAPNKNDAVNILQIGPQGIGFSRNGYGGPYLNAWTIDGTFIGEFIKAHSIKAEALETEYTEHVETLVKNAEKGAKEYADDKITTQVKALESQITLSVETERKRASGVEEQLASRITVTQGSISSEVSRATSAELELSSRITQTESKLQSVVSKGEVESMITQTASKIRLEASAIVWKSDNSSMTANGTLTCKKANIEGTIKTNSIRVLDDELNMYDGSTLVGRIQFQKNVDLAVYQDGNTVGENGNLLAIRASQKLGIRAEDLYVTRAQKFYKAYSGIVYVVGGSLDVQWSARLRFINGILVEAL